VLLGQLSEVRFDGDGCIFDLFDIERPEEKE
jgi:hypothetical protein